MVSLLDIESEDAQLCHNTNWTGAHTLVPDILIYRVMCEERLFLKIEKIEVELFFYVCIIFLQNLVCFGTLRASIIALVVVCRCDVDVRAHDLIVCQSGSYCIQIDLALSCNF